MKYNLIFGNRAVALPYSALEIDDINALRLLMLLSSDPESYCDAPSGKLCSALGIDERTLLTSAEVLIKNGLLSEEISVQTLNGLQITEKIDGDRSIRPLIDEIASICGVVSFNNADMSRIIYMKNDLCMEPEAIALLFSHLSDYLSSRGERVSVAYALKTAVSIKKLTASEMSEYIEAEHKKNSYELKIRKLFGLGDGRISPKYAELFTKWQENFGFEYELIECAYDTANPEKNKPNYIDKILTEWFESGVKTVDEAKKHCEDYKNSDEYRRKYGERKPKNKRNEGLLSSLDDDNMFEDALKKSYDNMLNTINGKKDK